MMTKKEQVVLNTFLSKIQPLRSQINNIYLFGSRARGTPGPNSDYDLLLVVPQKNRAVKDKLYNAAVDMLVEDEVDVSLKIIAQKKRL